MIGMLSKKLEGRGREAHQDRLDLFRKIFNFSPEPLALVSFAGCCIREANEAFCELLGCSREEILGRTTLDLGIWADPEEQKKVEELVAAKGKLRDHEFQLGTKTGDIRTALLSIEILAIAGSPHMLFGLKDISARKRAEEDLRRSEERLRLAHHVAKVGTFEWNLQTGVNVWTPELEAIYGLAPGEFGKTQPAWELLVHPEDRGAAVALVQRALETGEPISGEWRVMWRDGSVHWIHGRFQLFKDDTGRPLRLTGANIDITERKQVEAQLGQSQKTFSELVERAPFGIYVVDSQFRIAQMNRGSQAGAFRNVRPVIGRDFAEVMHILWPEPVAAEIIALFRHTLETGEPYYSPRFVNPRHDIAIVESYEWELHRMTLPDGQFGVICYYFDSTKLRQAEAAMRESNARLALAVQAGQAGTFDWDAKTDTGVWSKELLALYGLRPEEFGGRYEDWIACLLPEDREAAMATVQRALETGELALEFRIRRRDNGEIRWMHGRGQVFFDSAGKPSRMIGINADITERKQAEEALRERESLLRLFIEHAPVSLAMFDREMRYLNVSRRWLLDYNLGDRDLRGLSHYEVFPEIPEKWKTVHRRGLAGETVHEDSDRFERADGSVQWLRWEVRPWHDSRGNVAGIVIFTEDITERKRAEDALRDSEERFRVMANSIPQLAWIAGGDGYLYWYNQRWYEYTGTTPEQMEGWGWQSVHDPEVLPDVLERWKASIATGKPFDMVFPLRGADGLFRQFLTRVLPLKDSEGRIVQWFGTNTDITERMDMEEELRRARDELEERVQERTEELSKANADLQIYTAKLQESNQALQDFASIASHDLQEPLRKITSFGMRLKSGYDALLEGEGKDYLDRMLNASERMRSLLDALLEYSRITTKAEPFREVDLSGVIEGVLSDLEIRIEKTGGQVEVGTLPVISAEPTQMRQLFQNLIGNALKFHKEGERPVVKVQATTTGAGDLQIAVEDNGIGFEEKYLDRIFAPFQRLHGRSSSYEGTGMGLAICKKIVERHGGRITAGSTPGKGSTFLITLPFQKISPSPGVETTV